MKTLRELLIERINHLGGEDPNYYAEYTDYDLLDDFENLIQTNVEAKQAKSDIMDLNN